MSAHLTLKVPFTPDVDEILKYANFSCQAFFCMPFIVLLIAWLSLLLYIFVNVQNSE